ncbi:metallopeptidase family M24 [Indivirus ILV1]|uniref:Metallopeptidase family M24 n=1 Tax=Indivirus ILV1 TaxID=1977633 RepID=A0A1V0SDD9_9VIRU|nr:metallopeptidase family M24 [Indivirus ILV1]
MSTEIEYTNPFDQLEDNEKNLNKYKDAGLVATKVMNKLVKLAKPNKKLIDLINQGNKEIIDELNNVQKDVENKGISFPICLSVNHIAGHYQPNLNETLKDGDLLKMELGVQIDGFPAQIAFTTLVTNSKDKFNDKRSNVLKAAIDASREISKIMKPGIKNTEIVKIMEQCAGKYNCSLPISNEAGTLPGVLSFQMSRYVIDGHNDDDDEFIHRFILSKENPIYDFGLMELELEENEVYAIDIVMCSGQGKLTKSYDTCVFKRNHKREELKLKASRMALNTFKTKNIGNYPITINNQDSSIKLGLKECLNKGMIEAYPIVSEKTGEYIARIKFTIIVKDKPILICGKQADGELCKLE